MNTKNDLVVKANKLIEARYKLNLNEQKILLYSISKLDSEQEKFNILSFKVTEFTELIGTTKDRYSEFKEIIKNLIGKRITIDTEEKELITTWLSSMEYKKDEGIVELEFSEKLIPYLLQLKKQFTRYQLENILHFKNKYSIRVYELCKQYQKIGKREFEVDEFRKMIGCEENKYTRFYDFERFVLNTTKDEVNEHTDIHIDYEKIKKGRSVSKIKFTIKSKPDEQELIVKSLYTKQEIDAIRESSGLSKNRFDDKQLIELYSIAVKQVDNLDIDVFEYIKLNYQDMIRKGAVRNPYAYFRKALEQDFANAKHQIKFNFDANEDKIKNLEEQIKRTDNEFIKHVLQTELDKLLSDKN